MEEAVNDMMNRLNLTTKEEAVIEDSDDEGSQGVILEVTNWGSPGP